MTTVSDRLRHSIYGAICGLLSGTIAWVATIVFLVRLINPLFIIGGITLITTITGFVYGKRFVEKINDIIVNLSMTV